MTAKIILDTTLQLTELNAKLFEAKTTFETKLALIKEEIHLGQYQINTDHIAKKLMECAVAASIPEVA